MDIMDRILIVINNHQACEKYEAKLSWTTNLLVSPWVSTSDGLVSLAVLVASLCIFQYLSAAKLLRIKKDCLASVIHAMARFFSYNVTKIVWENTNIK